MRNSDLHTHSYYSDGELSPKRLIRKAKKSGIKNLALTDHCSIEGIEEAIKEGKKIGVNVIPGVEIVAKEDEVLGYFIDYKNKKLKKELFRCGYYQNEKLKMKVKELKKLGINISFKDIVKRHPHAKRNYNGAHLFYWFDDKGYSNEERDNIIKSIKIKKPKKKDISIVSVIKLIKKYGGVPVLAHPWLYKKVLIEKNIKKYVKAGLKGIELENGDVNKFGRTKKIVARIRRIAKKYNLIMTSGSDFHGKLMIKMINRHKLGKYNCDEKVVNQLKSLSE